MKLLGNKERGQVFIISAPAGTGKTTLVQMLTKEFPCVVVSVSYTTRLPRGEEVNGVHYNFVTKEEFERKIEEGEFLEYAKVYGDYYGTSRHWVENRLSQGKHVLLVIDTQGALSLKEKYPASFIFIAPPSIEELRNRLVRRGTEKPEKIEQRLEWSRNEMQAAKYYDYYIVNDDLHIAYQVLKSILIAVEHSRGEVHGVK